MFSMTATYAAHAAGFLTRPHMKQVNYVGPHLCSDIQHVCHPGEGGYDSVSHDHRARRPRRSAYIDRDAVTICLVTSAADRC